MNNVRLKSSTSYKLYEKFTSGIKKDISANRPINYKSFSCRLNDVSKAFEQQNNKADFNRIMSRFAEFLVSKDNKSLAGIVYSLLIKLNQNNPKILEELATKALKIAKQQHDPVHTMARANDLKRIYKITQPESDKHIKILYDIKRSLTDICTNYDKAKSRYKSVRAKLKPVEQYEIMLGSIKLEIGKALLNKDKKLAIEELQSAYEIFSRYKHSDKLEIIEKTLAKFPVYIS